MVTCENCGRDLDPGWKFCIGCGTRLTATALAGVAQSIPAAIRPDDPAPARRRSRLDVPLLIGIALGTAGVVLIVYLTITILGPHG